MRGFPNRLTRAVERRIIAAIRSCESRTSAEVRVHVDVRCSGDALGAAEYHFARLGMQATEQRNSVLIYVASGDRKFAILGDEGIHAEVGEQFWSSVRDEMERCFRAGDFLDAIESALRILGDRLSGPFPRTTGDVDELSNDVSIGES